jgi:hypothetical protein
MLNSVVLLNKGMYSSIIKVPDDLTALLFHIWDVLGSNVYLEFGCSD